MPEIKAENLEKAIFYHTSRQKTLAKKSKMALEKSGNPPVGGQSKIVTEITPEYPHKRGLNLPGLIYF